MADIDSLEIEISAESSSAAQKVNSLTQALRKLKSVLQDSAFGAIRQKIAGIGEGAGEAQKKVARKQRVLQGTREKLQKEGPLKKVRVSVKSARNDLSAELAEVPEAVKTVNGMVLKGPRVDNSAAEEINHTTSQIESLQEAVESAEKLRTVDLNPFFSKDQTNARFLDAREAINQARKSHEVGGYESIINEAVNASGLKALASQAEKVSGALEEAKGKLEALRLSAMADLQLHPSLDSSYLTEIAQLENAVRGLSDTYGELQERMAEPQEKSALSGIDTKQAGALERLSKQLKSQEFGMVKDLQRGEIQAIKTSGQLEAIAGRLEELKATPSVFSRYSEELLGVEKRVGAAEASFNRLLEKAGEMKQFTAGLKNSPIDLESGDAKEQLDELISQAKTLRQELQTAQLDFKVSKERASDAMKGIDVKPQKLDIGPSLGKIQTQPFLKIASSTKLSVSSIRSLIQPSQELLGALGKLAESGFKKAGQALNGFAASGFEKAGSAMKSLAGNIGSGVKSIATSIGQKFINPIASAISAFQRWKDSIGKMAFYRAINAAVQTVTGGLKTGMDNLYQFSQMADGRFASSMDSLASSSLYLKNSLGSMAAPLINAVAPAIDFIISKLVALINLIGTVFAVITGAGSFTQAKKQATAYGDALGGAAGAAKELQDYVLGIDELNVIREPSGGGGGGGGGGMGFEDMFEEVPLPDWAQEMQDAIKKGDWYGAGSILAEHLNKIIEDWDSYAWGEALGSKITHGLDFALGFLRDFNFTALGEKLADAINGLAAGIEWETLGQVIGAGWNALFDTIYGFATTLNWAEIGHNIAQAFNGWQDEVRWDIMGQAISEGLKGLFGMINTALTEIRWGDLGGNLATMLNNIDWYGVVFRGLMVIVNAITGFREFLDGFIETFSWSSVAEQIYSAVNDAFAMMDWKALGGTLGNLFIHAFDFLREIIGGINWSVIGQDIGEFISAIDWKGVIGSAKELIRTAVQGVIDSAKGFIDGASPEVLTAIAGGIAFIFLGAKAKLAIAIIELFALLKDKMKGIGEAIGEAVNKIDLTNAMGTLGKALSDALSGAIDLLNGFIEATDWAQLGESIVNGIGAFLYNVNWEEIASKTFELLGAAFGAASALVVGLAKAIGDAIGNAVEAAKEYFKDKIEECGGNVIAGIWKGITDAVTGIFTKIKEVIFQPFIDGFKAAFGIHSPSTVMAEQGGYIISGLLKGISDGVDSLLSFVGDLLSGIGTAVSETWEAIKTTASEAWGKISTTVTDAWEGIKTTAGDMFSKIGKGIGDTWENVKTTTSTIWDNVTGWLGDTWESLFGTEENKFGAIRNGIGQKWVDTDTDTNTKWSSMNTFLNTTWSGLETAADLGFTAMSTSVKDNWEAAETKTDASWNAQKTLLEDVWSGLETTSKDAFEAMYGIVDKNWTDSSTSTTNKWQEMVKTTTDKTAEALKAVKDNYDSMSGTIVSGLTTARTAGEGVSFYSIGSGIAAGISAGFQEKLDGLKRNMVDGIYAMKNAAKVAAGIHSPSRLFRDDVGVYIGLGVAEGVEKSQQDITASILEVNASMMEAFSQAVTGVWSGMQANVRHLFDQMVNGMAESMEIGYEIVIEKWNDISSGSLARVNNMVNVVTLGFSKLGGAVSSSLQSVQAIAQSFNWAGIGRNMVSGITQGVNAAATQLADSVANTAYRALTTAKTVLGIHSPSTVARDLIGLNFGLGVAEGVTASARNIVASIQDVNAQMLGAFDLSELPQPEEMRFPVHEDYTARYRVEYTYDTQHEEDAAQRLSEGVRVANEDLIAVLYAVASRVVEAVNNADRQPRVYLDGREIANNVEKHQRQRGATILAGGMA